MKGLVFGKNGQVGRCLAAGLGSMESTWFLDREQADLSHPDNVRKAIETLAPDVVINAAAYTAVDRAESEPALAHTVNAEAPGAMAEACARTGAWLIHYSTDYVFDGTASEPYTEDAEVSPLNVYGRTKLAGEEAIRAACDRHLIFRTSWVYSNHGRNFLNTMLRLGSERDELNIVSDQVGAPTYAGSIADATDRILHALSARWSQDREVSGTYHMTCVGSTTWFDFARRIFELSGLRERIRVNPIPTSEFPTPAARPMFSVLANDKLERQFGVRLESWNDALYKCLSERDPNQQ
ncbi:MAG: dTDP-4-dehydrorhamnose reductase [Gammaproteobacteria bacterium]|nr:dTDP-4-dehydrorhamnose reductase [Gammaproteobacteria bacterium]